MTIETEVANAVKTRIDKGEGSPYACLMKELRAREFNTEDKAVRDRWADVILNEKHGKLKGIRPPEQKEFRLPLR